MQAIVILYLISAGVMGLYFNYLYAVENGFWAWVFFGEIVANTQNNTLDLEKEFSINISELKKPKKYKD